MRLVLYCDESVQKGAHYSNFYGGALINEADRTRIEKELNETKISNNLLRELKWTRITENYEDKYANFINKYFDLIDDHSIKIRIMFTQNRYKATSLTNEQQNNSYSLLYYQFIKHAFGLRYVRFEEGTTLAVFLDDFPHKNDILENFREYIASLSTYIPFRNSLISIRKDDVTDVNSNDHVIMQGLDIILGAMQFRLNDKHLQKLEGTRYRGKRTRAKERIYKLINKRICAHYPNFNIGASTGTHDDLTNRWSHRYRHWVFVPSDYEIDESVAPKRKIAPPRTT